MNDELRYLLARAAQGKHSRRAFLGRAAALGVSAGVAGTLLSTAARAQGPVKGGHLKMGMGGGESTNSLDPALALSQVPFSYLRLFGDTLVHITPDGRIDPRIAEEVTSSDDAGTWYFRIRKGVEFHNGKTVTPEDVMLTLQRHSDENTQSGAAGIMEGIEAISVDGDIVQIALKTPNADLPYLFADYHLVIQPGGGIGNPADGIGSGPYKVEVNEPGVRHMFVRNENYWDGGVGHWESNEILVINDATARTSALQSGQVQMINRIEPRVADLVKRAPGVSVRNVSGRGHYVFIMHCNTAPFDNHDLRMALKYAIDRQDMVDKILAGYGGVGNDMPVNAAYPLFDDSIPQREYDPEKAAFHYKASGHDGPILLRTADGAFPGAVDAAALFQESAAAAGIPIEIQREPNDGYWSEVWNKQPFCASYWGGRPVQDQMYSTAYLSSADWNDTRFFNDQFDALILQARGETDEAVRKQLYSEASMMVRDDGGLICPMFNDFIDAHNDQVAGWDDNPNGEMMNGFAGALTWQA